MCPCTLVFIHPPSVSMGCQAAVVVHLITLDTILAVTTIKYLSLTCRYNNKAVPSAVEILPRMIPHFIQWGPVLLVLIIQDYKGQTPRIATHRQLLVVGVTTIIKVTSTAEFTTKELEGDTPLIISINQINNINNL